MKKFISILLALVLCLSLAACGGRNDTPEQDNTEPPTTTEAPTEPQMTKDEMLAVATELDGNELVNAVMDNKLRAQETYVGNTYLYTANVSSIEQDHAVIGYFNVYMPTEDLMKLNTLQQVTVVGQITALDTETEQGAFGVQTSVTGEMPTARLVADMFEITGQFLNFTGTKSELLVYADDGTVLATYNLTDAIPTSDVGDGRVTINGTEVLNFEEITLLGKLFYQTPDYYKMTDIELVTK